MFDTTSGYAPCRQYMGIQNTTPPSCGLQVFPLPPMPSHLPVGPDRVFFLSYLALTLQYCQAPWPLHFRTSVHVPLPTNPGVPVLHLTKAHSSLSLFLFLWPSDMVIVRAILPCVAFYHQTIRPKWPSNSSPPSLEHSAQYFLIL